MDYIIWIIAGLIFAVLLYVVLNFIVKLNKTPQTAEGCIYNAVYFIHIKQYQKALELLALAEKEYAMLPEVMCDLCVQRADAYKGLEQFAEAADAYDVLYEAVQESERALKRNDTLLAEIKACYEKAGRAADFEKWAALFAEE